MNKRDRIVKLIESLDAIICAPKTFVSKLAILSLFLVAMSLLIVSLWLLHASSIVQYLPFFSLVNIVFTAVSIILFVLFSLVMYAGFGYWGTLVTRFQDHESGYLSGLSPGQTSLLGWIRFIAQLVFVAIAISAVCFIGFNVLIWQVLPDAGKRTGIVQRASQVHVPKEWKLTESYVTDPTANGERLAWPTDTT